VCIQGFIFFFALVLFESMKHIRLFSNIFIKKEFLTSSIKEEDLEENVLEEC